jgi:hypothetical protein
MADGYQVFQTPTDIGFMSAGARAYLEGFR